MPTLLGVFDTPTGVAKAVTHLKGRGFTKLDVYSPAPFDEIEEAVDPKPSIRPAASSWGTASARLARVACT